MLPGHVPGNIGALDNKMGKLARGTIQSLAAYLAEGSTSGTARLP